MKLFLRNFLFPMFFIMLIASPFWGCDEKEDDPDENGITSTLITNFSIPKQMSLPLGGSHSISGKGFLEGDELFFQSTTLSLHIPLTTIRDSYASFVVSEELQNGTYKITLERGKKTQELGTTTTTLVYDTNVPNKGSNSIKGAVYCGLEPMPNVRVSDGIVTTVTDENGHYWLNSEKKHGYVFICTPSGYQPRTTNNATPGFWASLSGGAGSTEQHNFELVEVDNTKHTLLVAADLHLANRGASSNNDMAQFANGFMKDARNFVEAQGNTPVYALMLGDMSWDAYWYSKTYDIASYKETVSNFAAPMYHVIGNHDYDPYHANDFDAEVPYKKVFGPTYFSMDMGEVHYIFLDNVIYLNKGGMIGTIGDRDYHKYISDEQAQWLIEDLATVTDKTRPIVVSFHCPTTSNYNANFTTSLSLNPSYKATEFHNYFNGFTDVHFLSGHTHHNTHVQVRSNIQEHNIAAVCETWWWSGKHSKLGVCRDGSPAGYGVFEVNGRDISWYYKSVGLDKSKQFRSYDMNEVKAFYSLPEVSNILTQLSGNRLNDYSSIKENDVLVNVYFYDTDWTIDVKEDGTSISANRVFIRDPLHTYTYDYLRQRDNGSVTDGFVTNNNAHMFLVKTKSPSSTLDITVTDRFGNVYTETMTRPKEFNRTTLE